ncbi:MAG: multidrug ABC transporter [Lachnospiraceae bacterium]|nr:multidrug ABC transporter [Lachnospiraceae bacterium]
MRSKILTGVLIYLVGVFFSSVSQIILKTEANKEHKNILAEYLNVRVILGYGIIFACTMLTILAYRSGLPVGWGNVLETAGYVFVTILGCTILKEKINAAKITALAIIAGGIILFTL